MRSGWKTIFRLMCKEISEPLFPRLDLIKYQRFVSMLASLSGTIINRSQVGRSLDISEKSVRDYLEIVEGSYIWRNVPSYETESEQINRQDAERSFPG